MLMKLTTLVKPVRALLKSPRQRILALFAGVLVPLYAFGDLVEDIWTEGGRPWDRRIQEFVHRYDTPARDRQMQLISRVGYAGGVVPLDVAVLLALVARKRQHDARFFGSAVGGSALLN